MARRQTTDPEVLLDTAYSIARGEGLGALSIRRLAADCGVSVGTVYTYFPSKGELVAGVIDRFFRDAFCSDFCVPNGHEGYVAFCRRLSASIDDVLRQFRTDWLAQIEALPESAREASRAREAEVQQHVIDQMAQVLEGDRGVSVDYGGSAGAEAISALVFHTLASSHGELDRQALFALLGQALYGDASSFQKLSSKGEPHL
ncbi:MAG: TetR/AcrR family transcriptional regulator [Atopobiaceae bacterium]|jgi:AcrR family transcriptional regulator|nr:TetR/AcrR family transcriptional regulator [Atopobiaceae bacterium]